MIHPAQYLAELRRPGLLMQAVRCGLADYRRKTIRSRLVLPASAAASRLQQLIETEARLEANRCRGGAGYSCARHIEVLITLLAESRPLPTASTAGA